MCVLSYCFQWLLGCRTKQNWLHFLGLNSTHTKDQEHADVGWWEKRNEPEVSYFDPYLHLTSVSPDLQSGPERKEEGKLIIWTLFTNTICRTALFTIQFTAATLFGTVITESVAAGGASVICSSSVECNTCITCILILNYVVELMFSLFAVTS